LPAVENGNNYKTIEIQSIIDRSKSVDPMKKLHNKIPRASPLLNSGNKQNIYGNAQYGSALS
jgi:hypothetical protein